MSYSIYPAKHADSDDPEPTLITQDAMLEKLRACGVHPDSPAGRSVLVGGQVLADDANRTFWTPVTAQPARAGLPTWAQRGADKATAQRAVPHAAAAGRDLGDEIADEIDRQLGRTPGGQS